MPRAGVCVQWRPGWRAGPTSPPSAERLRRGGQSECAPQAVRWVAFREREQQPRQMPLTALPEEA